MTKEQKEKFITLGTEMADLSDKSKKIMQQVKADMNGISDDKMKSIMDSVYNLYNYLDTRTSRIWDSIYQLQNDLYDHANVGHLPKIQGAGKMNEVLKKVGLSDDAEAKKKIIYASQNGKIDAIVQ